MEECFDDSSPLPAAISCQGLKLNGIVRDGVTSLSQEQSAPDLHPFL